MTLPMPLRLTAVLICLLLAFAACERVPHSLPLADYLVWLADEENKLVRERHSGGMRLRVKYLPPDYLAWRELQGRDAWDADFEALSAYHRRSISFLFSIDPAEARQPAGVGSPKVPARDAMSYGLRSFEDYAERVMKLNFGLADQWELRTEKGSFRPVLTGMENSYELGPRRSCILVFAPPDSIRPLRAARDYDLVFKDETLATGISHFRFRREDFESLPQLQFKEQG